MDLVGGLVGFGTFAAITSDLIDLLLVSDSTQMTSDSCLEPDHGRDLFQHPVYERLLLQSLAHYVVCDRSARGFQRKDFGQVFVKQLIV